jgi:hypothetical protein
MEELFSSELKHLNIHAAGSGGPPELACTDLYLSSQQPHANQAHSPECLEAAFSELRGPCPRDFFTTLV